MNDASPVPANARLIEDPSGDAVLTPRERIGLYFAVALGAGAVIALQIDIMRVFSVGSWAHFGSLVVSLAMFGFGLTSAVMTIAKDWFARHWRSPRPFRSACSARSRSAPTSMSSASASTPSSSSPTPRRSGSSCRCFSPS